jgi:hypothetical protein
MSNPVEIPVASGAPLYSERITLDGIEYIFKFDWTEREDRWFLSIFSVSGTPLALGIKIVANWSLLRRFSSKDLPQGVLAAVDMSPQEGESPGFFDFGTRVKLLYYPVNV